MFYSNGGGISKTNHESTSVFTARCRTSWPRADAKRAAWEPGLAWEIEISLNVRAGWVEIGLKCMQGVCGVTVQTSCFVGIRISTKGFRWSSCHLRASNWDLGDSSEIRLFRQDQRVVNFYDTTSHHLDPVRGKTRVMVNSWAPLK